MTRTAVCPTCKQVAVFTFVGDQKDGHGNVAFGLWNCGSCGSTISDLRLAWI